MNRKLLVIFLMVVIFLFGLLIYQFINRQTNVLQVTSNKTTNVQSTQNSTNQTQIIQYKQVWIPEKSVSGSCWTASIATPSNERAWRCISGNTIYDPCFEVGNNQVVCDPDPEKSGSGLTLTLTEKLPSTNDRPNSSHPWIYELIGNIKCYALTGTAENIDGILYYYDCNNKALMQGDELNNSIQKDTQPWLTKIVYTDNNFKVTKTETLPILKIWQ